MEGLFTLLRIAPPEEEAGDACTLEGARRLKATIEAYWAARGKTVRIWLHEAGFNPAMRSARTDVRSNMLNGQPVDLPPAAIEDEAEAA